MEDESNEEPVDAVLRTGYFQLWAEDLRSHREGIMAQGFWALRIHRFSAMTRGSRFGFIRLGGKVVHRPLSKLSQIFFGIYIGANAVVGRRCVIEHFGGIIIHSDVKIGDDVILRQGVTIGVKNTNMPTLVPTIGNRVDIGAGAKILGKIMIGDDVSIGANSVVLIDIPAGSLAVGIPATIKKRRLLDSLDSAQGVEIIEPVQPKLQEC